jgi:hypothetical protein
LVDGNITTATSDNTIIRDAFQTITTLLSQNSNSQLKPSDYQVVFGADVASGLSRSGELVDFIKQQANAPAIFAGKEYYDSWFLPPELLNVTLTVEDTMENISEIDAATQTRQYIWPAGTMVFLPKKNKLKGSVGSAFSAAEFFQFEPMNTKTFYIPWNAMNFVQFTDNTAEVVTSAEQIYILTGCLG